MNPLTSVVLLWTSEKATWSFGPPSLMAAQESTTAKFSLITDRWCALHPKKALATRSPYSLPRYMFLDLPRDVICSVARFRLHVHTLRFETATWNPTSSPTCDLCEADDDVQDEQHVIFHCTHPHTVSLRSRYESIFSEARAQDVYFLAPEQQQTLFFLHELMFFMSRLAVARFD